MTYSKKLLLWLVPALNVLVVTCTTAIISVLGISVATDHQVVNLGSAWNVSQTFYVFLVTWLAQFAVGFLAYLKQSPIPTPDE